MRVLEPINDPHKKLIQPRFLSRLKGGVTAPLFIDIPL
jgi:hypothetical protein